MKNNSLQNFTRTKYIVYTNYIPWNNLCSLGSMFAEFVGYSYPRINVRTNVKQSKESSYIL